jgi:hypothetical protein
MMYYCNTNLGSRALETGLHPRKLLEAEHAALAEIAGLLVHAGWNA